MSTTKPTRKLTRPACPKCKKSTGLAGRAVFATEYRQGAWRVPKEPIETLQIDCPCGWSGKKSDLIPIKYRCEKAELLEENWVAECQYPGRRSFWVGSFIVPREGGKKATAARAEAAAIEFMENITPEWLSPPAIVQTVPGAMLLIIDEDPE